MVLGSKRGRAVLSGVKPIYARHLVLGSMYFYFQRMVGWSGAALSCSFV